MEVIAKEKLTVEGVSLTYTLTVKNRDGQRLYSLTVREERADKTLEIELYDLTVRREEAFFLFQTFRDGTVTVSTAVDILSEVQYSR